ncbi:MAG: hypothetical protein JNM69_37700 [Archangium sp.]|nr:hypothetical protein [Archangium sp.]
MIRRLVVATALLLLGCPQNTTSAANAFVGANALVLVDLLDGGVRQSDDDFNRYLFVTSTNTNELRVLDLKPASATGPAATREPLRAPNPLETLSIPVIDRPTGLSLDTRYEGGIRKKGSLLYVIRQGGAELSVVGVEPSELREVRRIPVGAPVTAVTNLMPDGSTSRVWIATFDGSRATVLELTLPASAHALRQRSTSQLVSSLTVRLQIQGEAISALLAVPGLKNRTAGGRPFCDDPSKACLAIATRRLAGTDGSASLVDPSTLGSVALDFPGPIRGLSMTDSVVDGRPESSPGAYLYGVLDEEACGSSTCGGLAAVDTRNAASTRFPAVDQQPIRGNAGLIRSVSIVAGAQVRNLSVDGGIDAAPVVGLISRSNGELTFFDPLTMLPIDLDPTASSLGEGTWSVDPAGWLEGPKVSSGRQLAASVRDGALRSQTITVTWQGDVGSIALSGDVSNSFVAGSLSRHLATGDALTFTGGAGCPSATVIGLVGDVVQFAPSIGCGATGVQVRAGGSRPYVIRGSLDGLLGRAASGTTFQGAGLVIPFGTAADTQPPAAGATWAFDVLSGATPLTSVIDPNLFATSTVTNCPLNVVGALQLPGGVVFEPLRGRVLVAFPSTNVVAEFDPLRVGAGPIGPNEGVICYR